MRSCNTRERPINALKSELSKFSGLVYRIARRQIRPCVCCISVYGDETKKKMKGKNQLFRHFFGQNFLKDSRSFHVFALINEQSSTNKNPLNASKDNPRFKCCIFTQLLKNVAQILCSGSVF